MNQHQSTPKNEHTQPEPPLHAGGRARDGHAASRTERTSVVSSDRAPRPLGAYPHARKAGGLLFLSGIGPRKPGTTAIPGVRLDAQGNVIDYDIEAQCRSCFDNVCAVLEEAGSSIDHVVDVLVFLTDMPRDFAAYNRIYAEYFSHAAPCRTTIEITRLPQGGDAPINIEVKVVATLPDAEG